MHRKTGGKPPTPASRHASFEAFHDIVGMAASDPLNGAVISGRYEILGRIGQGGMARIYLANDRETGSRVAVKILSDNPERNEELTERLFIEAKAAATINHPNVIVILDIGTYKDKTFCVMEYIQGRDLASQLSAKEPMRWERAKGIIAQICDALEAAHEKGVIHRDMKPENVMLTGPIGAEHVKVLDFGLAKLTDSAERLTRENMVLGTPTYMAPEQAWSRDYDKRVDIYSLGVIAYELVCGTVPFHSDIPDDKARMFQVLLMHKETAPEKPSERVPGLIIPKEAEAAILRALEKDPAKRFQGAREFRQALLGEKPGEKLGGKPCEKPQEQPAETASTAAPSSVPEAPETDRSCEEWEGPMKERMAPWSLPPEERRSRGLLKRFAKRVILAGMVGAAGYAAYHYRDSIIGYVERLRQATPAEKTSSEPMAELPSTESPINTSYQSKIESTPRNATVYDITGGTERRVNIGRTPLETTFQNYENRLLITRSGYYSVRITITRSQPDQKVALRPVPRQGGAAADEQAGGSGSEPGTGPYGSDGGNGAAPNPAQEGR